MNLRFCKRFWQKKNLQMIFLSALFTIVYHKHTFKARVHDGTDDVTDDVTIRKPLSWDPLIGETLGQDGVLPVITRKEKEPPIVVQNEIDMRKMEKRLHRFLSKASFMDVPNELPPYSKIECRPDLGLRIPNIVHFVWFGKWELRFHQYLALRSAASIQKPTKLYLHLDMETIPTGPYWHRIQQEVPCLEIMRHEPPTRIFGHMIKFVAHKSDVVRMEVLYKMGGIYLDVNAYFLNPMDDLMNNSFVMGEEENGCYGNNVMLAEPGAPFLELWHQHYRSFKPWQWDHHSTHLPVELHENNPEVELFVVKYSMTRPNYRDGIDWMLVKNWDLTHNYCVHLYVNTFQYDFAPIFVMPESEMIRINSTFGQIVRRALFGQFYFESDKLNEVATVKSVQCGNTHPSTKIPNILHFIWDRKEFNYQYYLSIRSAAIAFKPDLIMFHILGNRHEREEPFDPLWVRLNHEIPCISVRRLPADFGKIKKSYLSDQRILRMKLGIALNHGGIVWDLGLITVRPMNLDLDFYSAIVVREGRKYSDLFVAGEKNSQFLEQWYHIAEDQFENSTAVLKRMIETIPHLSVKVIDSPVQMAPESWFYSNNTEVRNGAPAYYISFGHMDRYNQNGDYTIGQKTTYGQLARLTVFGTTDI